MVSPPIPALRPGPLRRLRIPYGLLGAFALVWAIEGLICRHPLQFCDEMDNVWRLSGQAARSREGKAEILCFGDSLVKVGIVPRVIEQRLGLSTFNLAVYAGQTSSSYHLLRQALEAGAQPKAVVLDCHSNLLAAATKTNGHSWAQFIDLRAALELCCQTLDPSLALKMFGAWMLPSFTSRAQAREVLLSSLRGEDPVAIRSRRALARNWSVNRGSVLLAGRSRGLEASLAGQDLPGQWHPRAVNVRYLEKFLNLAAVHGVRVFWVVPPARPDWQASREARGLDAAFTRFIQAIAMRHENLVVVDGRHSGYDATLFFDSTHLNCQGAQALSNGLALVIDHDFREGTSRSRWARLPGFQPVPADSLVEDFEQSFLASRPGEVQRF